MEIFQKQTLYSKTIDMTELELQQYLLREYPQENARCEWKEFKNLKNSFCGNEKDDIISYVSAIANMDLTFLVEHHLIERLVELNADNAKGIPVFIEP